MEFLTSAIGQLKDLYRSMTPGARVTSTLLLSVVVVSLGYLLTYQVSGPDVYLMYGESFTSGELRAMEAAFAAKKLSGYQIEGARIRVPRGKQDQYMAALAEGNALPYNYLDILDKTVQQASPWESKNQLAERIKVAKQRELSRIIGTMTGIQAAVVMYDTTTRGGLVKEQITTASVGVKPVGSQELSQHVIQSIRYLVARSIAGLKAEDVVVTNLDTGMNYRADAGSPTSILEDPYGSLKRSYEEYWTAKALKALGYVPGVLVTCNVELDPEKLHKEEELKLDPKAVPLEVTDMSRSRASEGPQQGGRPGYVAQGNTPRALGAQVSGGPKEDEEESQRVERSAVGQTRIQTEKAGMVPQRVTVAVAVPASYFKKVWQERNGGSQTPGQPPDPKQLEQIRTEETAKIRAHVAGQLPPAPGVKDLTELVTVTEFTDIPGEAVPQPGLAEQGLVFLGQYWTTLGLLGLGLVSLLMLRSIVRAVPAPAGPAAPAVAELPPAEASEEPVDESLNETQLRRLRRFNTTGKSLRDELSQLVAEDPETAANILRSWIGNPV